MANRFKRRLYTIEDIKMVDGHLRYCKNEDGTLFSGPYKTKIKPEDLPEWYLHGRYYKRWGYMSAKGITDMMYIPNLVFNHFLKDDCLLIAYGGKIAEDKPEERFRLDRYSGYDERVWGSEILTMLRGARKYSGFDIKPIIEEVRQKKEWLQQAHPSEFGPDQWDVDVDLLFIDRLDCPDCKKPQRVMRATQTADGGCDVVGHCIWCLQDWQWHCDAQGWPSAMRRFFHG